MTHIPFLKNEPSDEKNNIQTTILFAHGSGAPMDTDFMNVISAGLAEEGYRVLRFEFPFMAERRVSGKKRPPDRAPKLLEFWNEVIKQQSALHSSGPVYLMGKSLGGRMASMIADENKVNGCICLGYPFHPPGKPEKTRTEHLKGLQTPCLIIQGTRDPFGKPNEVETYSLSEQIKINWSEDGDHNLTPRKRSGRTEEQNWSEAVSFIDNFIEETRS